MSEEHINLVYFNGWNNFGDELSKFITQNLLHTKYKLVLNQNNIPKNLICIGSYLHKARDNYFIFGSGIRTDPPVEGNHAYRNLQVSCVRGPKTRDILLRKNINVPEIYGDPALLLSKFYIPQLRRDLENKIGVVPHFRNFHKMREDFTSLQDENLHLISPTDDWRKIIDSIFSCRAIISSSLHGLICSDAYNKPNLWIDQYKLNEGDFKFKDYFASQGRPYIKITNLSQYDDSLLYTGGNKIDIEKLASVFPFR